MMLTALGLMSGTSLDGVDVAMIETDGRRVNALGPSGYRPYTDTERGLLRQALYEAADLPDRTARPGCLREAERVVTAAHAEAVAAYTAQHRMRFDDIDIVGFHGQTVLHRPEKKLTVQIGDAATLAKLIHVPVMYDFRAADVDAGGQGAPFVPVYHRALAQSLEREGPIVVVNIGGVSNITYIDGDTLIACDTGPGNALLDDYMFRWLNQRFDNEGRTAALGKVDAAWIFPHCKCRSFRCPRRNRSTATILREARRDAARDSAATLTPLPSRRSPAWCRYCRRSRRTGSWRRRRPTMLRMLRES
jgi:anhydro-N-acetylmuramic acid kinase